VFHRLGNAKGRPKASRGSSFRFLLMRRIVKGSIEERVELGRVVGTLHRGGFCILKRMIFDVESKVGRVRS
jgi:hypothetical protein